MAEAIKDARLTNLKIRDRLDELCKENASSVLDDVYKFQRQQTVDVVRLYGRCISQVELAFSLLVEIAHGIREDRTSSMRFILCKTKARATSDADLVLVG